MMFRLIKRFSVTLLFLAIISFANPQKIFAGCFNGAVNGPDPNPPNPSCKGGNNGYNDYAEGDAVYSCADNYYLGDNSAGQPIYGHACYWHHYICVGNQCGGTAAPSGGCPSECRAGSCGVGYNDAAGCSGTGPNFGCKSNQACCSAKSCSGGSDPTACGFIKESCNVGDVVGPTVINTQCRPIYDNTCSPLGSAQVEGACCHTVKTEPSVCGDWYYCPTKSNPTKMCRDCTAEVWECRSNYVYTYGCVSTCAAISPSAPSLSTPTAEQTLVSTSVNLIWTWPVGSTFGTKCPAPNVNQYQVYIDECAATGAIANPTTLRYTTPDSTTLNYSGYAGFTKGKSYCWKIMATNGGVATASTTRRFKISADITGTVFNDINNNCGGSGWSTGGVSVSLDGGAGTAVSGTGTYSIAPPDALGHTLAVSIPSGYSCSTAAGCNTCSRGSVVGGSINNFYLTAIREAWWRVEGAPIYAGSQAGGVTVRSEIPIANYPLIQAASGAGTSGALIRGSGSVDLGTGTASNDLWSTISRYRGKKMDYNYFAAHMGVVKNQASDWQSDTLNLQAYNPSKDFWYVKPTSGTASISTPWTVGAGEKYVIFVNGDLQINSDITVTNGGFLALIVNGNVTVSPSVLNLQGIYVMDDNFVTESAYVLGTTNDVQLTTQGSVIAWGSFSLGRNMGVSNVTTAVERFYYRPDLLTNMPDKLKVFAMEWKEVAAGSFGQ